jgi:hypothetical protein
MIIGVVVDFFLWGASTPHFIYKGVKVTSKVTESVTHDPNYDSISICLFYIYFYRYNYLCLEDYVMCICNLLDCEPSRSGSILRPSESMRSGILGTNPHQ